MQFYSQGSKDDTYSVWTGAHGLEQTETGGQEAQVAEVG